MRSTEESARGIRQVRQAITGLTFWQGLSIFAALALVGGGIAALLHNYNESDFRPAYTSLAPEDAAAIVQKLKESGVEHRLAENGATILIPSGRMAETRLALAGAGLPKSGRIGFELFDKTNFGATELVEHVNYQRALEGELERSIMSMSEVVEARVHLTMPKTSVFLDQQQPAKASVMVKLKPGATLAGPKVIAVANLVASAVEGLNPEAIAVLDMNGNLLNRPRRNGNDEAQVTAEALEVRRQIERDLVAKISDTLEPLLGTNMFRVGASVECDLTSGEQQEETFDPEKSVMVSSQKTEDDRSRSSSGGIPGTASNLPNPPAPQSGSGGSPFHRTENVTYQSSRTIRHTRIPQGVIKRMSLSILVGQEAQWEVEGKTRRRVAIPRPPETLIKIRDLVSGATGFAAERGDQLIVETLPFESVMNVEYPQSVSAPKSTSKTVPPAQWWIERIRENTWGIPVALGILLLILTLVWIAIRKIAGLFGRKQNPRAGGKKKSEPNAAYHPEPPAIGAAASSSLKTSAGPTTGPPVENTEAESPAQIAETPGYAPKLPTSAESAIANAHQETVKRISELVSKDMNGTVAVLRSWLP